MMNEAELKIRYESKVRFWFEKFERLSNENEELLIEIERISKIANRNSNEIFQVIKELEALKQQSEKMEFDHVELQK